jgi:hypothetical protein
MRVWVDCVIATTSDNSPPALKDISSLSRLTTKMLTWTLLGEQERVQLEVFRLEASYEGCTSRQITGAIRYNHIPLPSRSSYFSTSIRSVEILSDGIGFVLQKGDSEESRAHNTLLSAYI